MSVAEALLDAPVAAPAVALREATPSASPKPKAAPVRQAAAGASTACQAPAPADTARRGPLLRFLRRLAGNRLLLLTVVLPTAASGVYHGLFASDIYVSESKFVVRMPQRQQQPSLMGALLQGSGFMRSQDDTFSVHEYMQSRDALEALDRGRGLRAAYSAPSIDRLSRFPAPWGDDSFESLFRHYGRHVTVSYDTATSISTLRVTAFTAEQAHALNARLLDLGENLVNQINARARNDLVSFARTEVEEAEKRTKEAAAALADFRNARTVFDPERQSALQLQGVAKLQEELTNARAALGQVAAAAAQNPQIASLQLRVRQLEEALGQEKARVTGRSGSLTSVAGAYERLAVERAFADRQLGTALAALESARSEGRRQQLYLERVVQPNLPDFAIEPRRLRSVLATLLIGLVLWGVASLLSAAIREHRS